MENRKAGLQDLKLELWLRLRESGAIRWTTINGDSIPINNMSDRHLINAIAMLQNKEKEEAEAMDIMDCWDPDIAY